MRSIVPAHISAATMDNAKRVRAIISGDPARWRLLEVVRSLRLPDCWIGAGFVRNAIWDCLHGRARSSLSGDVDVVWFDPGRTNPSEDREIEAALRRLDPSVAWDVKNQARMHLRNGDEPYVSATDAIRCFPETATAVAVRRSEQDHCDIAAPFGLDDLFGLIVRPTPSFAADKRRLYDDRIQAKGWLETWPLLRAA